MANDMTTIKKDPAVDESLTVTNRPWRFEGWQQVIKSTPGRGGRSGPALEHATIRRGKSGISFTRPDCEILGDFVHVYISPNKEQVAIVKGQQYADNVFKIYAAKYNKGNRFISFGKHSAELKAMLAYGEHKGKFDGTSLVVDVNRTNTTANTTNTNNNAKNT